VRHINSAAAFWGYGVGSMVLSAVLLYMWFKRSGFLDA
jgi:magnesium transporter